MVFWGERIHGSRVDGQELLAVRGSSGHCSRRVPLCSVTRKPRTKRDSVGMEM